MRFLPLKELLEAVQGATFASIDAVTTPCKGVRRVVTGENVMLFTNKGGSAYEKMVKSRLKKAGKNPESFSVGELPWGARIAGTPFIAHKGKAYLQTIILSPGTVKYYMGTRELSPEAALGLIGNKEKGTNQGLPVSDRVVVQTYMVDNIVAIRAMGKELVSDGEPETEVPYEITFIDPEYPDATTGASGRERAQEAAQAVRSGAPVANDTAPIILHPAPEVGDRLKMAALKSVTPNDDDAGINVWATAEYRDESWRLCDDITGPMREVMELNGYLIVKMSELRAVAKPSRETLRLSTTFGGGEG